MGKEQATTSINGDDDSQHNTLLADEQQQTSYKPFSSWCDVFYAFVPRWQVIESKDSLIRDLLAAERTQLAWTRTALAILALGLALAKFLGSNQLLVKGTGIFFISSALFVFAYAWMRFQLVSYKIRNGVFTVDTVASSLFLVFGIAASVLALLLIFL